MERLMALRNLLGARICDEGVGEILTLRDSKWYHQLSESECCEYVLQGFIILW